MVEVDCDYCGTTVDRYPYEVRDNDNIYCGRECMYADRREDRVEVECTHCGKTLTRRVGRVERSENHYCDNGCNAADMVTQVEVECATCGATLQRQAHHAARTENSFCDINCKAEWQSEHHIADGCPNWTGGADTYYGPGWREHRAETMERDNHECALCGLSDAAHRELYGNGLAVHHMTPREECESWSEANAAGNLLTVCMVCHCTVFDAGYYTPGGVSPADSRV